MTHEIHKDAEFYQSPDGEILVRDSYDAFYSPNGTTFFPLKYNVTVAHQSSPEDRWEISCYNPHVQLVDEETIQGITWFRDRGAAEYQGRSFQRVDAVVPETLVAFPEVRRATHLYALPGDDCYLLITNDRYSGDWQASLRVYLGGPDGLRSLEILEVEQRGMNIYISTSEGAYYSRGQQRDGAITWDNESLQALELETYDIAETESSAQVTEKVSGPDLDL